MGLPSAPRAIVTGAGSGLGRGFCLALASRGASLVAADVDLATAEETCRLAVARGAREARATRCDVTVLDEVAALRSFADEALGGVDLLVNNAGVAAAGAVGATPIEDWRWVVGVNLWGVVHGCHVFVPWFKSRGGGTIINIASVAGLISAPLMAPYNVTKAGVVALSETMHAELRGTGVHVTVVCPSFFQTNIIASSRSLDDKARKMAERLMRRAKLDAEGVAKAALHAADRGELYAVPMSDARWMWRLKRLVPASFQDVVALVKKRVH